MAFEGGLDAAESEEPICRIGIIADVSLGIICVLYSCGTVLFMSIVDITNLTFINHHLQIQYADREDVGVGFWGRNRYYSDGVRKAMVAAEAWNAAGCCKCIANCLSSYDFPEQSPQLSKMLANTSSNYRVHTLHERNRHMHPPRHDLGAAINLGDTIDR